MRHKLIGKKFRHYKTKGIYEVRDVPQYTGDDAADLGPAEVDRMVYYYSYSADECFTRPLSEFIATVEVVTGHDEMSTFKTSVPRFEPL